MRIAFKFMCKLIIVLSAVEHASSADEAHLIAQYDSREAKKINS